MSEISDKLKALFTESGVPFLQKSQRTVWRGPEEDGITFSLLSRFLVCRERFRLLVAEGLRPADHFNHRIEYGNLWHICEEAHAHGTPVNRWELKLQEYCRKLCQRYPNSQEQIDHWYNVCKVQFPLYVLYWSRHADITSRVPLLQEQTFNVPYRLPSERTVKLRGKWDSVDLTGKGKAAGIYLQENKTKGDINEQQLKRQLTFDLQTMLYLVALQEWQRLDDYGEPIRFPKAVESPILGVRYNVIRRPLSGGKGTIKQCKGESKSDFYKRLAQYIMDDPGHYFMRWRVEVGPHDVARFRCECLDPILEQLCDWWEAVSKVKDPWCTDDGVPWVQPAGIHWRHPFGVWNVLDEGGSSDLDNYLETGSEVGLQRTDNLFPELE